MKRGLGETPFLTDTQETNMADQDKDIIDVLEESGFGSAETPEASENIGNEAANSVNIRVYIDGFGVQFTHRRNTAMGVIKIVKRVIETAKENGWKTSWKDDESDPSENTGQTFGTGIPKGPSLPPITGTSSLTRMCPMHGLTMEQKYSKAKAKFYFAHYDENHKPCFGKGYMT